MARGTATRCVTLPCITHTRTHAHTRTHVPWEIGNRLLVRGTATDSWRQMHQPRAHRGSLCRQLGTGCPQARGWRRIGGHHGLSGGEGHTTTPRCPSPSSTSWLAMAWSAPRPEQGLYNTLGPWSCFLSLWLTLSHSTVRHDSVL